MKKVKWTGLFFFAVLLIVWGVFFFRCENASLELFPERTFDVFPLNDSIVGGFSTSQVQMTDTLLTATVNIRSGRAFTYAGVGFKLNTAGRRPGGFLDLTRFDSVEVRVASKRMNSMKLRVLTDDPVYSRNGDYTTLRVLEREIPSAPYMLMGGSKERFAVSRFSLSEFRVAEWWLSAQGLDRDDGLTHLNRAAFFEVASGGSTLRGIPDEMEVRYVRFWGDSYKQKRNMFVILAGIVFGLFLFLLCSWKYSGREHAKKLDA